MGRESVEIPHYPHQGRHLRHRCQKRHCHVTMWTEYAAEPGDDSMSHTTDLLSRNGSMSMLSKQNGTITQQYIHFYLYGLRPKHQRGKPQCIAPWKHFYGTMTGGGHDLSEGPGSLVRTAN